MSPAEKNAPAPRRRPEAAEEEPLEAPPPAPQGGALRRYGPLAVLILLAQLVLAWLLIHFVLHEGQPPRTASDPPPAQAPPAQALARNADKMPFYFQHEGLNNITLNPAGTNSERYAVVSVQLGLVARDPEKDPPKDDFTDRLATEAEILDLINRNVPKIKAIIVQELRKKTIDQLDERQVPELSKQLRRRLNRELFAHILESTKHQKKQIEITELLFTEMVVQ